MLAKRKAFGVHHSRKEQKPPDALLCQSTIADNPAPYARQAKHSQHLKTDKHIVSPPIKAGSDSPARGGRICNPSADSDRGSAARGASNLAELARCNTAEGGATAGFLARAVAATLSFPSSESLPECCGWRGRGVCWGLGTPFWSSTVASGEGRAIGEGGGGPGGSWKGGCAYLRHRRSEIHSMSCAVRLGHICHFLVATWR